MNNLKSKVSGWLSFLVNQLKKSLKRFPVTVVVTEVFALMLMVEQHSQSGYDYQRLLMALALAMPITAIVTLLWERLGESLQRFKWVGIVGSLLIPVTYYLMIPTEPDEFFMIRFAGLLCIFYAMFLLMPYFSKREGFSQFIVENIGRFFLTALYALILYLGFLGIFYSVESLFDLNFPSELPFDIFVCVFGLFGVPHFLGNFLDLESSYFPEQYSKIFKTLFLYILIPIQSIYTLILYAYFIRLLFLRTLPEGVIGNLVLWYAVISFVVLFLVRDLRKITPWIKKYTFGFSLSMIIPLAMYGIAMGIRIDAYGITFARYFGLMLSLFLVLGFIMLPFDKKDKSIATYVLAICIAVISLYGALSFEPMVLMNQNARLESALQSAGFYDDNGAWQIPNHVSEKDQQIISEHIRFLTSQYDASQIDALPDTFTLENPEGMLGFELYYAFNNGKEDYFDDQFYEQSPILEVGSFDYFFRADRYEAVEGVLYDQYNVKKAMDDSWLKVSLEGDELGKINLDQLAESAHADQGKVQTVSIKLSNDSILSMEVTFINIYGNGGLGSEDAVINNYQCYIKINIK